MSTIEKRLSQLGLTLPPPPPSGGVYQPVVVTANTLYASGHVPLLADGTQIKGVAGKDLTAQEAKEAARQVGLCMLASIKEKLGNLDKIHRLVKTLGMVNCTPDFQQHPFVINGFSELMLELWGEEMGVGARSAVGMMLPHNFAVEVEAIFELQHS